LNQLIAELEESDRRIEESINRLNTIFKVCDSHLDEMQVLLEEE